MMRVEKTIRKLQLVLCFCEIMRAAVVRARREMIAVWMRERWTGVRVCIPFWWFRN